MSELLGKLFGLFNINPIYGVTIIGAILSISYCRDFSRWDQLPNWHKSIILSTIIGTSVFAIFSLLIGTNIVKW